MKTNYFVIQLERDDKYMALIGFAAENENMTNVIKPYKDLYHVVAVNVMASKEKARQAVDKYNSKYKAIGKSLLS